jgi:hypothetical protein
MKTTLSALIALLMLVLSVSISAEQPTDDELEAQITIIKKRTTLIEEFRRNGTLYMVKITPKSGFPYYLIDSDGDGSLETKRNHLEAHETVRWEIFRW